MAEKRTPASRSSGRSPRATPIAAARPSFVIAAHNEEGVIGACVQALMRQGVRGKEVVVVANGCTDRTAAIAAGYGVTVIDRPSPGKSAALNAGDAVALTYPRIYLDADIVVPAGAVASLMERLGRSPKPLAVVPRRVLNTAGRAWPVRAYYSINERLPVFRSGLFGRGLIAVAEEGRKRFGEFPEMIADDLFLDSQFEAGEKAEVNEVVVAVEAPYTTRDLINRLVRVRRGNAEMRAAAAAGSIDLEVRPADRWAWLRVAMPEPRLWVRAAAYVAITVLAARRARRASSAQDTWVQDTSTRERAPMLTHGVTP